MGGLSDGDGIDTAVGQTRCFRRTAGVPDPGMEDGIVQLPADSLDPNTDLAGLPVTAKVGELPSDKIFQAIESARQKAERLSQRKIIRGAFIALQNVFAISDGLKPYISPVSETGD